MGLVCVRVCVCVCVCVRARGGLVCISSHMIGGRREALGCQTPCHDGHFTLNPPPQTHGCIPRCLSKIPRCLLKLFIAFVGSAQLHGSSVCSCCGCLSPHIY